MVIRDYSVVLQSNDPEEGYTVTVPSLPGCISCGDTLEEALENIKDAIALYIRDCIAHGEPVLEDPDIIVKVTVTA